VHSLKNALVGAGPVRSIVAADPSDRDGLVARLARQESEIDSLCAEVLERYEEATFVYRLSERIGSVLGERAIADVSGHGVGAALYMAIAKGALQSEAREILSAGDVLGRVNEVLASDFSATDMFATLVFARFFPDGRRIVWSNAGHNPPILLRANGDIETLRPCGPALGIVAGARWRDVDQRFAPGDVLLLYTDGLIEARQGESEPFGIERLIEAAQSPARTAADIRENILNALSRHVGATTYLDDVTLVVARGVAIQEGS